MNLKIKRRLASVGKMIVVFACLGMLSTIQSCNDDDNGDTKPTTLAGVYQFSKVTLAEPVTAGGITLPAGWDVTDELVEALFALSTCSEPSVLAVDLKANKQLFFGCTNSAAEVQAGTWDESADLTSLTLNLVLPNPADPANPNLINLVVENVEATSTTIKGRINGFPLNSYGGNPLDPPLILSINVEFSKVP